MKLFNTFILTSILFASSFAIQAQEFEVPKDITLEEKEDFEKYRPVVLRCIDWLAKTPINQQKAKRDAANRFLLTWLAGTDQVTIQISNIIGAVVRKNPSLLMTFMAGWAKHELNNPSKDRDVIELNKAAILSCFEVYEFNLENGFRRNRKLEKLNKRNSKGKLDEWIRKKLHLK